MNLSFGRTAQSRSRNLLGGLLLLSLALYANTLFNGFVLDDHYQIERNPYVRSFQSVPRLFTTSLWSFQGKESASNFHRPLLSLGFLLGYQAFGASPYGFHLMNVLLNVAVVGLVWAFSRRLFGKEEFGFLAALVFALHPIHTEPVAWIDGLPDVELTLFYLLSFLLFLRLGEGALRHAARIHAGILASFALALLSKETAMTLPLLVTAYEHFVREDRAETGWRRKLGRYAGFWVMAGIFLLYRAFVVAGGPTVVVQRPDVTWPDAILTGIALTARYTGKIFWPVALSSYYPFQKSASLAEPRVLAGLGILLSGTFLFFIFWKKDRRYSFALLWILLTLAPALNARWMAGSVFAERYWYLPSVGFSWLVAGGILWLWRLTGSRKHLRRWTIAVAGTALALLAARATIQRNRDWRNDRTLAEKTLEVFPEASGAQVNLGKLSWAEGKHEEAERLWREALRQNPQDAVALWNLGMAMLEKKDYPAAIEILQKGIVLAPRYSLPHIYLGRVYAALGRNADAQQEFQRALALSPLNMEAHNALGRLYLDAGRLAEAEAEFRASVGSIPTIEGWRGIAEISMLRNSPREAEEALRRLLELDSLDAQAHFQLGAICLASGRLREAEKEYEAGLWMDPGNKEALAVLQRIRSGSGAANR
ncbi:MAG: tetratricopeptide repeat protein [Acidobacteriia bacterium]|nr:tetratricopeptide repeat protein [Terriglobia bacterium]